MGYSDSTGRDDTDGPGTALGPLREFRAPNKIILHEQPGTSPPSPPQSEGGGFEIWNLLRTLYRRKFLIAAVVVLGVAVSAVLTLRVQPLYRAVATLEVQARETQIIQGASVEPASVADADFMGTQVALLTSRALAERVAESLSLTEEAAYANQSAPPEVRLNQAASRVLQGLSVTPARGARVIDLGIVGPSPGEAARLANAIAENFIEMNLDRRYSATAYARRFLEERLAITKTALEDTERKLVEYSREKEILDLTSAGGSDVGNSLDASSLVSLNASLTEAQRERILAEQQYLEAKNNSNTREMLESPAIQTLRQSRSQLFADYQTKLGTLRPEHPEMIELQSRIKAMDGEIESERGNIVKALEAALSAAIGREAALTKRVAELKEDVQGLRSRSIDYNILQREADTLRTQYDALLQRLKEVGIASAVGSSQVSILDRAQVPGAPFEPNLNAALLRALALSLAVGVALALLVELLDDRIRTPDDVTSKLGLRVIGVIPRAKAKESVTKLLKNPRASVSEAYASARTALQLPIIAGSVRTILVTGSKPSEGKTTTALALAASFAAIGKKVLIIDADLRRPSFAFDSKTSAGLAGILLDGLALDAQVVPGPTPNLYLLPSGAIPPNPAELLAGSRLTQVIAEATENYDLVFVDSPPVLTFADAPILSSVCDATILVVQSGSVFRQTARRSIERLQIANATITGAVLTKFDARRAGYAAAYGYGYRGYGERDYLKIANAPAGARKIREFAGANPPSSDKLFE